MTLEAGREAIEPIELTEEILADLDEADERARAVMADIEEAIPKMQALEERNREIDEELRRIAQNSRQAAEERRLIDNAGLIAARSFNTDAPVFQEMQTLRLMDKGLPREVAEIRAREARRLIEEPMLREAFLQVERGYYDELLNAAPGCEADDLRRSVADRIRAVREVRAKLAQTLEVVRPSPVQPSFA